MPRIVEIPGVAELSFPDDLSEDEMLVQTRKFYEQSKQGAIGAASSATVREPARLVGQSMKAAARVGDWLEPSGYRPETGDYKQDFGEWLEPSGYNPETGGPFWQKDESAFFGPETTVPVEKPAPVPVEQTGLYQAGESLQRGAEKMFPVNPLRADDFLTQVGSGIGSIPTSVVPYLGQIIYAGATGEEAAEKAGRFYDNKIAEAMAAGNGAEASRLQEEKKFQQKVQFGLGAGLGYATERFMGVVPGLKQITEGGGKLLPKLAPGQAVENTKKLAGYFAKQGAKTTVGEFAQEGLEQAGGNLGEKLYNPEAEFLDGVAEASGVGGTVGFLTSVPLTLLGSKLRKNQLDRIKESRDTRAVEGPLSRRQVNEINNRIVSGQPLTEGDPGAFLSLLSDDPATQSSVGGNNAELLPNATATLAGINSGGAPSGPIKLVPTGGAVVTGGAPDDEAKIPDIALETDVADEEIATAVAPETVAASETSVSTTPVTPAAATEVQPLSIEETNEYNGIIDFLAGRSAYETLEDDQWDRFNDLSVRVGELERAGFQFDEATGWTKPGVVTQERVPVSKEPALNPEEYSDYVNLLRREAEAEAGDNSAEFGFGEKQALTLYRAKIATGVAPVAPAEVPVTPSVTPTVPAAATPTPAAPATSRTFPFQNRTVDGMIDRDTGDIVTFAKSVVGTPKERGSQPKYTIKIDQDVTIDAQSEAALDKALQRIAPGAPVRVFRNAGKGVTLDFNKPGPVTPTPAPTPAAAPTPTLAPSKKRYKAREWAFKGDILDDIIDAGGVMSKSQANNEGRLNRIKDLYDDAPRLDPYFNKIFAGARRRTTSRNLPDILLQGLAMQNPGKYGDMSVSEFWAEVEKAARGRKGDVAAAKEETKAAAAGAEEAMGLDAFLQAQDDAFVDAQSEGMQNAGEPDGPIQISVGSLALGDKFSVQGEQFEVTVVTPDGGYTIRDGDKFGVQQLTEYDTLFVDRPPDQGGPSGGGPGETGPGPRRPRLTEKENQGDLVTSTQAEQITLIGEEGIDVEARRKKAQAEARDAAEAKAAQDKAQMKMDFGQSALDAIDQITRNIDENQYSDPLLLTPLAKLALQIAKGLIRAGMAIDRAIRQAVAQARESYPNDLVNDTQLSNRLIGLMPDQPSQDVSSADTSLAQIPAVFKSKIFVPRGKNLDIGAGKFDLGKEYLESERGVEESVPFDPFNRSVESNRAAVDRLQSGERFGTTTVPNVLNVVAEAPARDNVVLQAAQALEPNGVAYFQIYEGDRSGNGRRTSKGFQNNKKTSDYVAEVRKHFGDVRTSGNIIVASNPKASGRVSFWQLSPDPSGPTVRLTPSLDGLSDAVAEVSDAIAQFVESITPKAGITEGPTPEQSARRVLEALTDLASKAILSGIRSASRWATDLQMKLSPALQYAWDRAQGSKVEPTPEVIADVATLPERATSSDFGMIYSTPGKPVTTKRGAYEDTVAGRRSRTPEVQSAGIQLAVDAFNEAGVKFRQVGDALFAPVEGVDQEAAGRKLIDVAKKKIAKAKEQGRSDTIAELIQSLRNHFGISEAFSPDTRDELYLIGQSEASQFGINLASLRASVKDFVAMARNVRGFLTSAIYTNFNGESVKGVMDKIMTEFRGQFTEAEIQKIVGEKPDLQEMLNRFGILALADTGGRVYRTVQARLTKKKPTTQKEKQEREIENEAIEQIIQNALDLGVTEPVQPPNRKLTADERLALMTRPGTQAKVQKATEDAVKQAEFNAGWAVMMASAAGNEELRAQYQEAKDAGEEPDPEAIEEGLDLPQYAHWRTIRDGFLNYSPTTLKLAQDVIRGRFKGTQFGPKKVAPPAPAKIDLARLVQSPNAEMSRVIGEQLAAIEGVMDLAGASPEAKARVMQMITANVGSQVQLARQRVLNNFLEVKAKAGPTTASASLQRLINAGIIEDKRYQSEPTRKLLKRVAKTYLTADELSGMATRPRAEKLAFLTGKLNQITAAENLTDEWMQGAVWTYLTERMMEAENAVVSQIVGAKGVSFDPAQPKTEAQLEADRAKAVERLVGGIRAGLLDQRIAESVAKNPALQRLVPKMSDLVKRVLNTPQAGQAKLAQAFSEALLAELAIDQALADKTGIALAKAFEAKFERARIQALDKAVKNLTPKQREDAGPGTPLWQKIEQFVNAGGMNSAALLQSIAKKSGWKIPTDEEVSRFRDLARLEQELSTATEEEINAGITDDIKAAMNEAKRMDIMRELQMRWAQMTMPIRGNKQNLARAAKEYGSANTLLKFGFITKQLIDVATQMFIYTPSRATATAIQRFTTSRDPNRTLRLWKDVSTTLEDAYKARFDALDMAYKSAIQAAKGRAEKDTIMGLQTGMRALDRLKAQADEYAKKGNYAQATVLRIIGIAQLSYRFASSLDAFQGVLAEQQEIGAWTESQLRLQGMAPAEARKAAKIIMGDALAEYALAQALIGDNPNIAPKDRSAAAWNVVRARQYQRIATAGLDAGDIKGITQNLRSTIGWNVEEEGGPGGVIGQAMKSTGKILSRVGIPDLLGMFSNAVAIGVNRGFTFAGGGFVPGAFEGSAWYKTETDKVQRKIEAATGLGLSGLFVGLVLSGALRVFTHWPDDKEEADLWEREGHKPNTMELDLPGGKILRVSLSTGPFQFVRPALAAVGELQYQQARRDRLNQKAGAAAKKKGLKFEPRELTAMDIVSALGYGAWSAIAQGRTTSGLIGAGTYRGTADVGKIAAATVSPLIPFGPLMREATAMSGAQFNPKDQTFINLLAPTPWSGKVDRNFLGDPVGTPRATERIMSILTGGTAIVGGEDPDRAYQVLAKTGWTPATPQSNKFFQFGRVQRQATPEELTRMQEVRAVELKTRISQLDPATATKRQLDRIEDIANAKSKKAVGIR